METIEPQNKKIPGKLTLNVVSSLLFFSAMTPSRQLEHILRQRKQDVEKIRFTLKSQINYKEKEKKKYMYLLCPTLT